MRKKFLGLGVKMRREILNRVILAKVLFKQGLSLCAKKNDQFKFSMGLIAFHDAVDQVLGAIAEEIHLPGAGGESLIQLFGRLESYDSKKPLLYGVEIGKLNTLRNNIKHKGILPDVKSNAHLPFVIEQFLQDACQKYFNIDFKKVSLADLIKNEKVEKEVLKAEKEIEEGNYKKALEHMGIAMFYAFEEKIVSRDRLKLFIEAGQHSPPSVQNEVNFPKFDYVVDSIELISKGIDIFFYFRFKNLTPKVGQKASTKEIIVKWDRWYGHEGNWTEENCLFCYDFLVDAVLKLQGGEYQGYHLIPYPEMFIDVIEALEEEVSIFSTKEKDKVLLKLPKGEVIEGYVHEKDEEDEWVYVSSSSIPNGVGLVRKSQIKITSKRIPAPHS